MTYKYLIASILLSSTLMSCANKQKETTNIENNSTEQKEDPNAIVSDSKQNNENEFSWGGKTYKCTVQREPATDKGTISNDLGTKFYDNIVKVTITCEGAPFYEKTFDKSDFKHIIKSNEYDKCTFQGMAFDEVTKSGIIKMGAQVGMPGDDEGGDPFIVEINQHGKCNIEKKVCS